MVPTDNNNCLLQTSSASNYFANTRLQRSPMLRPEPSIESLYFPMMPRPPNVLQANISYQSSNHQQLPSNNSAACPPQGSLYTRPQHYIVPQISPATLWLTGTLSEKSYKGGIPLKERQCAVFKDVHHQPRPHVDTESYGSGSASSYQPTPHIPTNIRPIKGGNDKPLTEDVLEHVPSIPTHLTSSSSSTDQQNLFRRLFPMFGKKSTPINELSRTPSLQVARRPLTTITVNKTQPELFTSQSVGLVSSQNETSQIPNLDTKEQDETQVKIKKNGVEGPTGQQSSFGSTKHGVILNTYHARLEKNVIDACGFSLSWTVHDTSEDSGDIMWHGTAISEEQHQAFASHGRIVNRFPGVQELVRKRWLARILKCFELFYPKDFLFVPETFYLPEDLEIVRRCLSNNQNDCSELRSNLFASNGEQYHSTNRPKEQGIFILKPDAGAQGTGLRLVDRLDDIPADVLRGAGGYIIQRYISDPLLINRKKFDMRVYALLTSVFPELEVYIATEALVRSCTEAYKTPAPCNFNNVYMHFTNFSINKDNEPHFIHLNDIHHPLNSKRLLTDAMKDIQAAGYDTSQIWKQIITIVQKTVWAVHPFLSLTYRYTFRDLGPTNRKCFQILGFDILLDRTGKAWLLEVNSNPSLRTSFSPDEFKPLAFQSNNPATLLNNVVSGMLAATLRPQPEIQSPLDEYVKSPLVKEALMIAVNHSGNRALSNFFVKRLTNKRLGTVNQQEEIKNNAVTNATIQEAPLRSIAVDFQKFKVRQNRQHHILRAAGLPISTPLIDQEKRVGSTLSSNNTSKKNYTKSIRDQRFPVPDPPTKTSTILVDLIRKRGDETSKQSSKTQSRNKSVINNKLTNSSAKLTSIQPFTMCSTHKDYGNTCRENESSIISGISYLNPTTSMNTKATTNPIQIHNLLPLTKKSVATIGNTTPSIENLSMLPKTQQDGQRNFAQSVMNNINNADIGIWASSRKPIPEVPLEERKNLNRDTVPLTKGSTTTRVNNAPRCIYSEREKKTDAMTKLEGSENKDYDSFNEPRNKSFALEELPQLNYWMPLTNSLHRYSAQEENHIEQPGDGEPLGEALQEDKEELWKHSGCWKFSAFALRSNSHIQKQLKLLSLCRKLFEKASGFPKTPLLSLNRWDAFTEESGLRAVMSTVRVPCLTVASSRKKVQKTRQLGIISPVANWLYGSAVEFDHCVDVGSDNEGTRNRNVPVNRGSPQAKKKRYVILKDEKNKKTIDTKRGITFRKKRVHIENLKYPSSLTSEMATLLDRENWISDLPSKRYVTRGLSWPDLKWLYFRPLYSTGNLAKHSASIERNGGIGFWSFWELLLQNSALLHVATLSKAQQERSSLTTANCTVEEYQCRSETSKVTLETKQFNILHNQSRLDLPIQKNNCDNVSMMRWKNCKSKHDEVKGQKYTDEIHRDTIFIEECENKKQTKEMKTKHRLQRKRMLELYSSRLLNWWPDATAIVEKVLQLDSEGLGETFTNLCIQLENNAESRSSTYRTPMSSSEYDNSSTVAFIPSICDRDVHSTTHQQKSLKSCVQNSIVPSQSHFLSHHELSHDLQSPSTAQCPSKRKNGRFCHEVYGKPNNVGRMSQKEDPSLSTSTGGE